MADQAQFYLSCLPLTTCQVKKAAWLELDWTEAGKVRAGGSLQKEGFHPCNFIYAMTILCPWWGSLQSTCPCAVVRQRCKWMQMTAVYTAHYAAVINLVLPSLQPKHPMWLILGRDVIEMCDSLGEIYQSMEKFTISQKFTLIAKGVFTGVRRWTLSLWNFN